MSIARHDPSRPIQGKRPAFRKDQHGRVYWNTVEIKTGAGVAQWKARGWSSPWMLESEYLKELPDPGTGENRLHADYQRKIDDILGAQEQWEKDAHSAMAKRYKDRYHPGMELDEDIKRGLGTYPGPVEPWVAALQGNPSALGWDTRTQAPYTGPMDARLVAFMPAKDAAKNKVRRVVDAMDFSVPADGHSLADDLEARLDIEEEFDPAATGGQPVPARRRGRKQMSTAATIEAV